MLLQNTNWLKCLIEMDLKSRIDNVYERVEKACAKSGRKIDDIKLVAVSKKFGIDKIEEAYNFGLRDFGENYAQEFRDKEREIDKKLNENISWHFIGSIQKNKVKYLVGNTSLIHTIDSFSLAKEFNKRAARLDCNVNSLIEINISGEDNKSGIKPGEVNELLNSIKELKNVNITGLMGMAPYSDNMEDARPYFRKLREIRDEIKVHAKSFKELSMGMSGDFEVAIEEGATIIRLGSLIFGERPY